MLMRSDAPTADAYLGSLPPGRREAIAAVRAVILANLPAGYVETMSHGMLAYVVPLDSYPETYNGEPFLYAALASQKRHMSLYLMAIYGSEAARSRFVDEYRATGATLDAGGACVRFRRLADLPLDVVGRSIASVTPAQLVARARDARSAGARGRGRGTVSAT
jgi:hypothetical protein